LYLILNFTTDIFHDCYTDLQFLCPFLGAVFLKEGSTSCVKSTQVIPNLGLLPLLSKENCFCNIFLHRLDEGFYRLHVFIICMFSPFKCYGELWLWSPLFGIVEGSGPQD